MREHSHTLLDDPTYCYFLGAYLMEAANILLLMMESSGIPRSSYNASCSLINLI